MSLKNNLFESLIGPLAGAKVAAPRALDGSLLLALTFNFTDDASKREASGREFLEVLMTDAVFKLCSPVWTGGR